MALISKHRRLLCIKTQFFYNYFIVFQLSQTFKKIINCINYQLQPKQSYYERSAKQCLGFKSFSFNIGDMERIACLNAFTWLQVLELSTSVLLGCLFAQDLEQELTRLVHPLLRYHLIGQLFSQDKHQRS